MSNPQRVVVITGGASGIGAACADMLAKEQWSVVIADVNAAAAQETAQRIGGHSVALDVTDAASIDAAAEFVEREVGPVHGLVNSAGITQAPHTPFDLGIEAWDQVQAIDLRGTYLCCLAFAKQMLARKQGSIVNISSVAGSRSMPLHSYAPAKAAVISMTQCLAAEWGPSGMRVNSVAPGYTLTPMLQEQIDRGLRKVDGALDNTPLQRLVKPEDVANAVSFLLSERAAAITGVDLPVDGGWLVGTTWDMYGGLRQSS